MDIIALFSYVLGPSFFILRNGSQGSTMTKAVRGFSFLHTWAVCLFAMRGFSDFVGGGVRREKINCVLIGFGRERCGGRIHYSFWQHKYVEK